MAEKNMDIRRVFLSLICKLFIFHILIIFVVYSCNKYIYMYVAYIFVHNLKRIKWRTLGAHIDNNTVYVESN